MPISASHLLGLMSEPSINEPLVDAFRRAIGGERMAKNMPAAQHLPFAIGNCPLEMIVGLVAGDRRAVVPVLSASDHFRGLAKQCGAAWVLRQPVANYI